MKLEIITERPKQRKHTTPLLFIHGAWHGAWCWENFLPYFAGHGYEAHALSLRGHGASEGREGIRWYSAAKDYVEDVKEIADGLQVPPILVGHSMGGYVVQKYLEAHIAPAGVLLASIPISGTYGLLWRTIQHQPGIVLKTFVGRHAGKFINSPDMLKETCFSSDFSDEEIARLFPYIQPESIKVSIDTMLNLPKPKKVGTPLLVLGAANDRVFSVAEVHATARAYSTQAHIFPNMAHDMMLEKDWQKVADKILEWLSTRGL